MSQEVIACFDVLQKLYSWLFLQDIERSPHSAFNGSKSADGVAAAAVTSQNYSRF